MPRVIEYTWFFIVVTVLQVFLFSNLNLGIYVHPLVYVAFILLLPMKAAPVAVLLLGLVSGLVIDVSTGGGGLNTIATVFTSFCRPYLLPFIVGRDEVRDGGIPLPGRIGYGRFFRYAGILVFLHCLVFFSLESLSVRYFYLTFIRIAASSAVSVLLIFFIQMLMGGGKDKLQPYSK